jgi:glycosyltransferase involved in cell wall biosynthesis
MSNEPHEIPCICSIKCLYYGIEKRRKRNSKLIFVFIISVGLSAAASLFLLIGVLHNRRNRGQATSLPSVAVIVAGRNESATIERCLRSIIALDYPPELIERYYVDDGSTDGAHAIASQLARASGDVLEVLQAPPNLDGLGPKKNALRAAIEITKADLLLFTDADAEVPRGWAKAMAAQFALRVGAVAGLCAPAGRDTIGERLYRLERLMHGAISAGCIGWGYPSSACGANFAYRRRCYEELGGFAGAQAQAGDDDIMAQAIRRHGWQVRFVTGADSTVRDLRLPSWLEFKDAKRRHQSTARLYPFGWLMFFWITIAAQAGYLAGWISAFFEPSAFPVVLAGSLVRLLCDFLLLAGIAQSCSVQDWRRGFFAAEVLLPFHLLMQPILALSPRFKWKERVLSARAAQTAECQTT